VTPSEALKHTSAELKDGTQRKVLLRGVIVVAQKGLGVAPDGEAECASNVLTFPTR
jgi:hypothetical protein